MCVQNLSEGHAKNQAEDVGKTDIELAIDDLWEGHELESEAHKGAHLLERERQRARIEVPPSRVVVLCAVVSVCALAESADCCCDRKWRSCRRGWRDVRCST